MINTIDQVFAATLLVTMNLIIFDFIQNGFVDKFGSVTRNVKIILITKFETYSPMKKLCFAQLLIKSITAIMS